MKTKRTLITVFILSLVIFMSIGAFNGQEMNAQAAEKAPYTQSGSLISAEQLMKTLGQPNLTVIDTRPRNIYEQGHIPGAIHFNMRYVMDPNRRGKFNSPKLLGLAMRECGVNSTDHIVVYSDNYNHAHLWLILNMYGLNVQMLNGNFEQWKANGYEITTGREKRTILGEFNIAGEQPKKQTLIDTVDVATAMQQPKKNVIIDARSADEYSNKGHIAGAVNITWDQLVNKDMTLKKASDLKRIFVEKGVTPDKQVIIYCSDSARASFVYFALTESLGYTNVKIYDGFFIYWAIQRPLLKGDR